MDNQFYPTPASLAIKAFNKFKSRNITRLLEPHAGRGDLVDVVHEIASGRHNRIEVDCCEIDFNNQAFQSGSLHQNLLQPPKPKVLTHVIL